MELLGFNCRQAARHVVFGFGSRVVRAVLCMDWRSWALHEGHVVPVSVARGLRPSKLKVRGPLLRLRWSFFCFMHAQHGDPWSSIDTA